ncbi:MAG: Sec-independent protein translocase protein TatAd [Firmicutes bacterium ADurb.Bin373]|nr:twin-arginine translocase TatA/TatE family subunit [Bacillota bacterium]OQA09571.1 MAG: Sec-independent protein translocase protein TatAd [Firmicutes bacterium ADurb.Bin373]
MFPNLGMSELVLILVIAMVIFGPSKLPEMGKALGKTMNEFRRASAASFADFEEVTKEVKQVKEVISQEVNQVTNVTQEKPH